MEKLLKNNKILWVTVTIALGALGSGLWDMAVKPFFGFLIESTVDFFVGLFDSFQKSIYEDIAHMAREQTGRSLLAMAMGLMGGIAAGVASSIVFNKNKKDRETSAGILPKKFSIVLFAIFIFVFSMFVAGKHSYVLDKQDQYAHLLRVIGPYTSPQERLVLESSFAQLSTASEYDAIINRMKEIAFKNGAKYPE